MAVVKELKLKARISDLDKIRDKVKNIAKFLRKEEFADYFFISEKLENAELRLRKDEFEKVVKLKLLLNRDQIQENAEYRFQVDRADDFVHFLECIGFKVSCSLHKKSELYMQDDIIIELANVESLGNYIELVIHCSDDFMKQNKKRLLDLSKDLGLKDIDSRYYHSIKEEREK